MTTTDSEISHEKLDEIQVALSGLIGVQLDLLRLPAGMLKAFEPSQIGTIVGTLMDAAIPELSDLLPGNNALEGLGLTKAPGILLDREGYPDFEHEATESRLELKLLYVDPDETGLMKATATRREPSARITQKVTLKNVDPSRDALLLVAYQLQPSTTSPGFYVPTFVDIGVFSMIECVRARDHRLVSGGGRWFGDYETPAILSRIGRAKLDAGLTVNEAIYGRKESEGHDFNEDTNFGKLKRVPYKPLQEFLRDHGADYARTGGYPGEWTLT